MRQSVLVLGACLSISSLAMACRGAPPEIGATADPELESMINQQAESAAPGSVLVNEALFRGVAYDRGEFQDFRVELVQGNCYTFVGAADQTVTMLHLFVWDAGNDKVADDKSKSRQALAQHCPKQTGTYKVQGKIVKGAGHFAIGIFGKEASGEEVATAEPETPAEPVKQKLDLEKVIKDEASAVAPDTKQIGNFLNGTSTKSEFFVELEKGNCYWFIGAGQVEVKDYYIYLWSEEKRIGESKAEGNKAQFAHCVKESGMFRVQMKVDDANDTVKLGVFGKKQKK